STSNTSMRWMRNFARHVGGPARAAESKTGTALAAVVVLIASVVVSAGPSARKPVTPSRVATIRSVHRSVPPDVVRVTLETDTEVAFHEERLANPPRVF